MIKLNKCIILKDDTLNYLLIINPRSKHIKISIDIEGMKVTIPKGINIAVVEQFLQSKEKWILKHYIKNKEVTSNFLFYKGDEITYKVLSRLKENSIEFKNSILNINLINELNYDEIRLIIKSWYIEMAKESFKESINVYSQLIGVKFKRICIREQKTRWGSCSTKGNLNFNWKLIMAPRFVLDYIVVHELCHLIHMNHSKSFWSEVESFIPNYKVAESWLKLNSSKLTFK